LSGGTHVVAHLVDYFRSSRSNRPGDQPVGDDAGWGLAGDPGRLWTEEELVGLRREVEAAGLVLEAIENFDPAHWHDVLLDGPRRREQIDNLKTLVRRVGRAGIPVIGYNFSIAGVAGRVRGAFARGEAEAVGMDGPADAPMPRGMVAYVHCRNVRGKVPRYRETFIDDGDVDIRRVLAILDRNGFDGVVIPDHAPQLACAAPWHAGMAFALGYLRAALPGLAGGHGPEGARP
jgi:D-mannonate dehydratase